jgi:hypothetical protein
MITFSTKTIETITYCIDLSPPANRVMDSIGFTNLFFIKKINYMIKIYGNKIEHQLKNKKLFETMITL